MEELSGCLVYCLLIVYGQLCLSIDGVTKRKGESHYLGCTGATSVTHVSALGLFSQ